MKRVAILTVAVCAPLALTHAQTAEEPQDWPQLDRLVDAWREVHGETWTARADEETGHVRFLFGGAAEPAFAPVTDDDFVRLARRFVAEAQPFFGVLNETLVADRVVFLPLGLVGSSDKVTVRFLQQIGGVPVRGGFLNALFLSDGSLISLDTTGLPDPGGFATTPTLTSEQAGAIAADLFHDDTGIQPGQVSEPELWIAQEVDGKLRRPALVWAVDAAWSEPGFDPEAYTYLIAAAGAPRLVAREDLIHYVDVGGTVVSQATPGLFPDIAGNPEVSTPMQYLEVTSSAGTVFTDENGDFNYPGVTGPLSVTVAYEGLFNDVNNTAGSEHIVTVSLTGTGNVVPMNPTGTEFVTSQANAFHHINVLRDWTRQVNPADDTCDFVADSNVNIDADCNAYFDGGSVNFYRAGGSCPNTGFSTVVAHEMGHWLNVLYGSGNGSDGFGEGNADVFAMYCYDDAVVGQDFFGPGTDVRNGWNTTQFCGDSSPGCYGEVHKDGEVLMGALWKVRNRLNISLGDLLGDAVSDFIFNSWMNAYDDGTIKTIVEEHWLVLDDDDGIVENGTPHYDDIDGGFKDQGFPGFVLSNVTIDDVTEVATTRDENGPYGVAADLAPVFAAGVASADLNYRVNGGPYVTVPMSVVTGNTWTGFIPGQVSPAKVDYYLEAFDTDGKSNVYPKGAPTETLAFKVGVEVLFFADDFETPDDNGWTHVQILEQDDWHHMGPFGKAGSSSGVSWSDPGSAFSGALCWGNDLGPSGWNGSYKPNVINYLLSPAMDLSSAVGSTLEFQRWLTVEQGIYDQASIRVNDVEAWRNPDTGHVQDTSWGTFELDISSLADGDPATRIMWRLETDGGLELGGWNIDDVKVLTFDPTPTGCLPVNYGAGLAGTPGLPAIDSAGQPTQLGNTDFVVAVKNGLPLATAYVGLGFATATTSLFGGTVLIQPVQILPVTLDVFGQVEVVFPVPSDPVFVGAKAYFQSLIEDPGAPGGFAFTPGLDATVCP